MCCKFSLFLLPSWFCVVAGDGGGDGGDSGGAAATGAVFLCLVSYVSDSSIWCSYAVLQLRIFLSINAKFSFGRRVSLSSSFKLNNLCQFSTFNANKQWINWNIGC